MRRAAAGVAIIATVVLLGASGARAGGFSQTPVKTTGPAVSATVVTLLPTVPGSPLDAGQTTIRVQKGSSFQGAVFLSAYVAQFTQLAGSCVKTGFSTVEASTDNRFLYVPVIFWVPGDVLTELVGTFGSAGQAVVTDIDNAVCTVVNAGAADERQTLSFTATIQFITP